MLAWYNSALAIKLLSHITQTGHWQCSRNFLMLVKAKLKKVERPLAPEDGIWLKRETEEIGRALCQANYKGHQWASQVGEHLNLQMIGAYQTHFVIYSTSIYWISTRK